MIIISCFLLYFHYELRITNYVYYGDTRNGVGCRMGGLRQACARTIHGYYYIWVENPFFMFVWIVIVWGDMGKPMNTTTMLDMCGMNNNNNDNIVSFVLSKSPLDILSLNNNNGCVVSTKSIPDHCRRPRSDSSGRSYWPSALLRAIDSNSMLFFREVLLLLLMQNGGRLS